MLTTNIWKNIIYKDTSFLIYIVSAILLDIILLNILILYALLLIIFFSNRYLNKLTFKNVEKTTNEFDFTALTSKERKLDIAHALYNKV